MRNTTVAMAAAVLTFVSPSPRAGRAVPHEVTLDVASLTSTPVTFRVMTRAAASSRTDAPIKTLGDASYTSPAKVVIGADATEVEIVTEHNQGVRVTFSAGASVREKEQNVWGRQILLRRTGGELLLEARALQIVPSKRE